MYENSEANLFLSIKKFKIFSGKNDKNFSEIECLNALDQRLIQFLEKLGFVSLISYILPPMIKHIYTSFVSDEPSYDMPLRTDYFYDNSKFGAYEVTFLVQSYSCAYAIILHVSMI